MMNEQASFCSIYYLRFFLGVQQRGTCEARSAHDAAAAAAAIARDWAMV
jgi:hypothetical protein